MKSWINRCRKVANEHLSQKRYVQLASFYHSWAAGWYERHNKKRLDIIVDCNLPLIYIRQLPRSGGTLLRSLFDGHPNCFVFPHELSWQKNGFDWTNNLGDYKNTNQIFVVLYDKWVNGAIIQGIHRKYPFHFNRKIHKNLFSNLSAKHSPNINRDWLGIYLTSFFNAWVDYQSLYGSLKQYCVAFCPQDPETISSVEIEDFFKVYPDGFRIQVIRDPFGWWASEKKYGNRTKHIQDYLPSYLESLRIGLQAHQHFPDRYLLISFTALIEDPERVLCLLCDKMALPFSISMLEPTVNNLPTSSNSSFEIIKKGLDNSVLHRWQNYLNEDEIIYISEATEYEYKESLSKCIDFISM